MVRMAILAILPSPPPQVEEEQIQSPEGKEVDGGVQECYADVNGMTKKGTAGEVAKSYNGERLMCWLLETTALKDRRLEWGHEIFSKSSSLDATWNNFNYCTGIFRLPASGLTVF